MYYIFFFDRKLTIGKNMEMPSNHPVLMLSHPQLIADFMATFIKNYFLSNTAGLIASSIGPR